MTLLAACQAAVAPGFAVPASIIANPDDTAVQLLALANRAGKLIAKRAFNILQKEHTFTTVASQATYALPADYDRYIDNTAWNRTAALVFYEGLSPQQWQAYKSGLVQSSLNARFRIWQGQIFIDPTPIDSTTQYVIEYYGNTWVAAAGGAVLRTEFAADTDTTLFPEFLLELELTWRFLAKKGLAYAEEKAEAMYEIERAISADSPRMPITLASGAAEWPPVPAAPLSGFGP